MRRLWITEARERNTFWNADGREVKAWGPWEPMASGDTSRTEARRMVRELRAERADPDVQYRVAEYIPK